MSYKHRSQARIPVETLCSELVGDREHFGLIVDFAESGLKLQRPLRGRHEGRVIQLEFEMPEVDEIVWAQGEICFDQLWRGSSQPTLRCAQGPIRTTGVRLVAAATRHLRMLRDYVIARDRAERREAALLTREARGVSAIAGEDPTFSLTFASHWAG